MHIIPTLALAGALAGLAGHTVLTRLRRGATVHKGWCVAGVAILWSLSTWHATTGGIPWRWLPVPLVVAWFAVMLTVVDLKHRRLPNVLTYCAYPAVAVATAYNGWQPVTSAATGAALLVLVYLSVHVLTPHAMGAGDVKLSGSQGAVLGAVGWPAVLTGTMAAAVLTLLLNALIPKRLRTQWQSGIPHGPPLLAATYVLATFPALT